MFDICTPSYHKVTSVIYKTFMNTFCQMFVEDVTSASTGTQGYLKVTTIQYLDGFHQQSTEVYFTCCTMTF